MMTHREITDSAISWLKGVRGCGVVFSEVGHAERPDALGIDRCGNTILVEAKSSFQDAKANGRKNQFLGSEKWVAVHESLLASVRELPCFSGWGVLTFRSKGWQTFDTPVSPEPGPVDPYRRERAWVAERLVIEQRRSRVERQIVDVAKRVARYKWTANLRDEARLQAFDELERLTNELSCMESDRIARARGAR